MLCPAGMPVVEIRGNLMLRIHFTDADYALTRVATKPDPLWEIGMSLHRFQTREGRWAHAEWYRWAREGLTERGLAAVVRTMLIPLFPRAPYYPDFLNPAVAAEGLEAGLESILATPRERVLRELRRFDELTGAPEWAGRLAESGHRQTLVESLRAYHTAVLAPYADRMQARLEADRTLRARAVLDGGVDGLLAGFAPLMTWRRPVLYVRSRADRDHHLGGRGLRFVPSYFGWQTPTTLADPEQPAVVVYPLSHQPPAPEPDEAPLTALLGRTRTVILRATATGATTGELARAAGVSAASASQHTGVLREAGLISSHRHAARVLHTLTPLGASLLGAKR
jgi:DNA-binding transcriptional ArsR family regulator